MEKPKLKTISAFLLHSALSNFFERIFTHSLTKKMAYQNDTPLLIFKG
jgi:hypothetical protein